MADTFARLRNMVGTEADWGLNNLVLGDGEIAFQRDGNVIKAKLGDGVQNFAALPWYVGNHWTDDGNVTYSEVGGPVVIGDPDGPALDRLTVFGGDYTIGVYRNLVPTDGQVVGKVQFGGWDAADTPQPGPHIRGYAVGTWNPADHGSGVEFAVVPSGTTTATVGMELREDGSLDVYGDKVRIRTTKTPSAANDTGLAGQIAWDSTHLFICVAANTWKRVQIDTW